MDAAIENQPNTNANKLAAARGTFYVGSAIMSIHHLVFDREEFDKKNLDRLEKIFEIEGCWNLYPEYRVAATVDRATLESSLNRADISSETLMDPREQPTLPFEASTKLKCIYGKHRIKAATRYGETRWLVDLYLDSKNVKHITILHAFY